MTDYDGQMRPLPWSLRDQAVIESETEDDAECAPSSFVWPEDPDERVIIPFFLSQREYTVLASCIDVGRDIAYSDSAIQVWELWTRNMRCEVPLCAEIIDCITNDQDTRDAIAEAIATDAGIRRAIDAIPQIGAPMGTTQLTGPLTDNDCDLDVLFAQITGLVETLDTNNRDFLEIMALASTPGKRLAQVLAAIPVLETLPIDDIVNYVSKMYDEIVAGYNAAWTDAVKDMYRCDLFCLAKSLPDCALTYDNLFNYFNERNGDAVSLPAIVASTVQYTILGTWSGTVIIDVMMLNQVAIWRAAGNWLGTSLRSLQSVIALSGDDPDPDWILLCTDCPENWCRSLTGSDLHDLFEGSGGLGAQALWSGTGWGPNNALINSRITLECDMLAEYQIISVVCVYSGTNAIGDRNSVTVYTEDFAASLGANVWTEETIIGLSTEPTLQIFEIDTVSSFGTDTPITVELIEVRISGKSTPPEWGVEC